MRLASHPQTPPTTKYTIHETMSLPSCFRGRLAGTRRPFGATDARRGPIVPQTEGFVQKFG
jgi:hypothetical protein